MINPSRLDQDHARNSPTCWTDAPIVGHVRDFADLLHKHCGEQILDWMQRVEADNLPVLHSLITDLRRDLDDVTAGLALTWNSGPVEGNVNRSKMINRQMYGPASFDLLRK